MREKFVVVIQIHDDIIIANFVFVFKCKQKQQPIFDGRHSSRAGSSYITWLQLSFYFFLNSQNEH